MMKKRLMTLAFAALASTPAFAFHGKIGAGNFGHGGLRQGSFKQAHAFNRINVQNHAGLARSSFTKASKIGLNPHHVAQNMSINATHFTPAVHAGHLHSIAVNKTTQIHHSSLTTINQHKTFLGKEPGPVVFHPNIQGHPKIKVQPRPVINIYPHKTNFVPYRVVHAPVIVAPYPYYHHYYYNDYNNVNTFLAIALGLSLVGNAAQYAAANSHNTVVYQNNPSDAMSVAAPIASTPSKTSQPVNVVVNNNINTTAPAASNTTALSNVQTTVASTSVTPLASVSGTVLA